MAIYLNRTWIKNGSVFELETCKTCVHLNWNLEKQCIWFGWVVFDPQMCTWTQPWSWHTVILSGQLGWRWISEEVLGAVRHYRDSWHCQDSHVFWSILSPGSIRSSCGQMEVVHRGVMLCLPRVTPYVCPVPALLCNMPSIWMMV